MRHSRKDSEYFWKELEGTALSLHHGFYPHVTSRDTTVSGCLAEAGIAPSRVRRIIMTCRLIRFAFRIRAAVHLVALVANFPGKKFHADRGSGYQLRRAEKTSTTGRKRRVAEFDWQPC